MIIRKNTLRVGSVFLFLLIFNTYAFSTERISFQFDSKSPKIVFAVDEVRHVLSQKPTSNISQHSKIRSNINRVVFLSLTNEIDLKTIIQKKISRTSELKNEGFLIYRSTSNDKTIYVVGADDAGAMYGGFELAEIIKTKGLSAVKTQLQNPYMKVRGTKFNIPLDMRTPTYTEPSDAAQKNMGNVWDFEFWKEYIDHMARNRYNLISLWNMHPFPSMVKVPEYPDVALNDVRRSTGAWKENYSLHGRGFDAPEIMKSYEVLKKMTIDEKIDFWRKVMAYGKQRNVNFYMITWNVWVYGTEGKYGITDQVNNPITTDYFRKSIKQMVLTYPDLAGIGLTTGENMYAHTSTEKEEWAYATYGLGVMDALKEQPNRKFDFIHRQHETQANEISRIFTDVRNNKNVNFLFSFKYAQAHVYSSVNQTFHHNFVADIKSENYKTLWTLRNDDNYYFRWGAPDFVREFIKNIPLDVSEGYYYGSDQYVWGRDFLTKDIVGNGELELEKHWYKWMIWGRLGYNPNMENDRFIDVIQSRFPTVNAAEMFTAWQSASMIYPLVTGFHWGALDFQWYIESGQSQPSAAKTPSGYHDVNTFIALKTHKGTDNIAIPEYVKAFLSNTQVIGTSPLQVADNILKNTDVALNWTEKQGLVKSKALRATIDDISTMAFLGKYYAHKIKASTYVALFRETFDKEWHKKAVEELTLSAAYWRNYSTLAMSNYVNPLWTNRVGYVDFRKNFQWALFELTTLGAKINLPSMKTTNGGVIIEIEDFTNDKTEIATSVKGFTGKGYIGDGSGHEKKTYTLPYIAETSGEYVLEFRYSVARNEVFSSPLLINGNRVGNVDFWATGNIGHWVWERIIVKFEKGANTIAITPERFVLLDHVNVLKLN